MRKIITFLLLLLVTTPTYAQTWNLDIVAGHGVSDTLRWDGLGQETDRGTIAGIAVSKTHAFETNLDIGLDLSRTKATYTATRPNNISGTIFMATARHNLLQKPHFEIYAGAGLGAVDVKYTDTVNGYANSEIEFAAQLMMGARYHLTPRIGVFIEGRYVRAKDAHIAYPAATRDVDYRSKTMVVGLRRRF